MRAELLPFLGAKNASEKLVTSALDLGRFGATLAVHSLSTDGNWALKAAAAARGLGAMHAPSAARRRLRVLVSVGAHYNYGDMRKLRTHAAAFSADARAARAADPDDPWQLAVLEVRGRGRAGGVTMVHPIRSWLAARR